MRAEWRENKFFLGDVAVGKVREIDGDWMALTDLPGDKLIATDLDSRSAAQLAVEGYTREWLQRIRS